MPKKPRVQKKTVINQRARYTSDERINIPKGRRVGVKKVRTRRK